MCKKDKKINKKKKSKLSRNTLGQNKEEMESKLSRKKANLWQKSKKSKITKFQTSIEIQTSK